MKSLFVFIAISLLLVCSAGRAWAEGQASLDEKSWTLVVYMSADNSLSNTASNDLNEIEASMESVDANVLILIDQRGNADTHAYRARYDSAGPLNSAIVSDEVPLGDVYGGWDGLTELDLANPDTLLHFCKWAVENYPAEHLGLVLWDHGDGWRKKLALRKPRKDICYDGYNSMDMLELKTALATLKQDTGVTFDLVGMDACLMGMVEVAYQIKDLCKVMVASEESVPWDGWDYGFLSEIKPGSDLSPKELAMHIVNYFYNSYNDGMPDPEDESFITLSAVDEAKFDDGFVASLNGLAQLLIGSMEHSKSKVYNAYVSSYRMQDYWSYVDLKDFMLALKAQNISEAISAAAQQVASTEDDVVYYCRSGAGLPYCYGLSIYFETQQDSYDKRYDGDQGFLDFTADTFWDEVLRSYYNPSATAPEIDFDPLPDTENFNEEITLSCFIHSELPLADGKPLVYYRTENAARAADNWMATALAPGTQPEQYVATLPGQPENTHVFYYLYVENIAGNSATSPPDAPEHVHSFWVRTDSVPPTIEHTPLGNQPAARGSLQVSCVVRDNMGVDEQSVKLYYHYSSGADTAISLTTQGDSTYSGEIPGDGLVPGDRVWYRIAASDVAKTPNTATLPQHGYFSFSIIPSLGSVLLIDDNSGGSADIFLHVLETAGYVVHTHTPGESLPDLPFDIVVYCLGDASEPLPAYYEGLVDYVLGGGRLLIESGDLAWSACQQYPSKLDDLRRYVLHIDSWKADYGDILILRSPGAQLATTPNTLEGTIGFQGEFLATRDVCVPAADASVLYDWSRYSQPGLIYFDDDGDNTNGGQIVYMTFAISYVSDEQGERAKLIDNCAYYLSNYARDTTPPVVADVRPRTGATVPPDTSISFSVADADTGVDRSTVSLVVNGATVSTKITRIADEHRLAVSYAPDGGFVPETGYQIEISACDFAGNCMTDDTHWFETSTASAHAPVILAGGFMQTQVLSVGDALKVVAAPQVFGEGNAVERVELLFGGIRLGVSLNDEGILGDDVAGDGIYSAEFDVPAGVVPGQYELQVVVCDALGLSSEPWPELHVAP